MEFSFGIPSQRGKSAASSVELYSENAAITVCKNAGPRTSKIFVLNTLAVEALGLEEGSQISFDLTKSTPILVNTTGVDLPKGMGYVVKSKKEYKGLTFKDSKLWAYFVKTYNLDETQDNNFEFGSMVSGDPVSFEVSLVTEESDDDVILAVEAYHASMQEEAELNTNTFNQ